MGTCLVLGGGSSLKADIAAYSGSFEGVVACNEAGIEWAGHLDAWVSLHPTYWNSRGWDRRRAENGYDRPDGYWSHETAPKPLKNGYKVTTYRFPGQTHSGSSGLFAAKVALIDLYFDRVVLCGIPMTETPHFWDEMQVDWKPAESFRGAWLTVEDQYLARMRSMSGWTRVLLGAPDAGECDDAKIHG